MATSHSSTLLFKKDTSKCNNMQRLSLGIPVKIEMIINSARWTMGRGERREPLSFSFPFPSSPARFFPLPSLPATHQRWRRLRKRHLKSEIALLQTLSRLIPSCLVRQMLATSFGVEFSRTVSKFRKRIRSCCLEFPSSTKREIWHFNVVVVKRRIRNVQKSVMHVQSCGFANRNLLLFCRSRSHRRRRCLSSLQRGFLGGGRCNKVTV